MTESRYAALWRRFAPATLGRNGSPGPRSRRSENSALKFPVQDNDIRGRTSRGRSIGGGDEHLNRGVTPAAVAVTLALDRAHICRMRPTHRGRSAWTSPRVQGASAPALGLVADRPAAQCRPVAVPKVSVARARSQAGPPLAERSIWHGDTSPEGSRVYEGGPHLRSRWLALLGKPSVKHAQRSARRKRRSRRAARSIASMSASGRRR
jgi:hypothetical protein